MIEGNQIKLIITDFDGTLVDTYKANLFAYQKAFNEVGLTLSDEDYSRCFGFRFERFMQEVGVTDINISSKIKNFKSDCYPLFFENLKLNKPLLQLIDSFRRMGGKTALASTSRIKNLQNVLDFFDLSQSFDLILSGESVKVGKPSPEIYQSVLNFFNAKPSEALVFEDTEVGALAAINAGINYVLVNSFFYGN